MQKLKTLILKKNEDRRILAGHLWIYSNEIDPKFTPLKNFTAGDLVEIESYNHKTLGIGYINPNTLLCARILNRTRCVIDQNFFAEKIKAALTVRERCFSEPYYRLVFSEGDFLPGLIIDRFNDIFVIQLNTAGMYRCKSFIIDVLVAEFNPHAIVIKNSGIAQLEGLSLEVEIAYGALPPKINVVENGLQFVTEIEHGQKTGWFFDQRANRAAIWRYVKNKRVLDVFSYVGAFGVGAAAHGAKEAICIDSSEKALTLTHENAALNNVAPLVHTKAADAFAALKQLAESQELFDVIILDPPAFIKKQKDLKMGTEAYLRLHELALKILAPDGILCTTSCSLHFTRDLLLDVIRKAALYAKRETRILEQLHQAADHPLHPAIAETNYLKGFIVQLQEMLHSANQVSIKFRDQFL